MHRFPAYAQTTQLVGSLAIATLLSTLAIPARADNPLPLTEATVDRVVNAVTVELQRQPIRPAKVSDLLVPEDKLATAAQALAQMIFNDASLIRVGQNSLFQFVPAERQLQLNDGEMVVVTPVGAGGATVVTPSAVAAVQGSLIALKSEEQQGDNVLEAFTFTSELQLYNREFQEIGRLQPGEFGLVRNGVLEEVRLFDRCSELASNPLLTGLHPEDLSIEQESEAAAATLRQERQIIEAQQICDPLLETIDPTQPEVPIAAGTGLLFALVGPFLAGGDSSGGESVIEITPSDMTTSNGTTSNGTTSNGTTSSDGKPPLLITPSTGIPEPTAVLGSLLALAIGAAMRYRRSSSKR
ncbi:FecR domain-containing protein [Synechococcus sp. PCC 7336]|uniref:FecR domain-containing protein n=1 Tax=Synechococcus sp. PCC 7336 TaxID=195250 RepID=UPI00034C7690|nr:FecR domain-containing protein [Synechococcus sp. PCC 7336]